MRRTYGYARVSSTDGQKLDRQINALTAYGIPERDIVTDTASGKDFDGRPGYLALKNQMLRPGDKLVLLELDRLSRDYSQLRCEWSELCTMGVEIEVLENPALSTTNKSDLEKALIANIIFELLAYCAEKERLKIQTRREQGVVNARNKGVKFGRPAAVKPALFDTEIEAWRAGTQTARKTMEHLGLKRTTFYRLVAAEVKV